MSRIPGALFLSLLFITIALPSGTLYKLPIKHIVFAVTILALMFTFIGERKGAMNYRFITLVYAIFSFVLFFILVGVNNNVSYLGEVFYEAQYFFTSILFVLIFYYLYSKNYISSNAVLITLFFGNLTYVVWKDLVGIALAIGVIGPDEVFVFFYDYLNYKFVTSLIYDRLIRINLIIYDFLTVIMLFMLFAYPKYFSRINKALRLTYSILAMIAIFFAFSRYLFLVFMLFTMVLFLYRKMIRVRAAFGLVVIGILGLVTVDQFNVMDSLFGKRFSAEMNSESDSLRLQQIDALLQLWEEAPLIGGGFGYYSKDYVRSSDARFSYEVQWLSFLSKFGIIGVIFILALIYFLIKAIVSSKTIHVLYPVLISLVIFLLGGFTNQYLISSGAGAVYVLHLAISYRFADEAKKAERLPGIVNG